MRDFLDWVTNQQLKRWQNIMNVSHSYPCGSWYRPDCGSSWVGMKTIQSGRSLTYSTCAVGLPTVGCVGSFKLVVLFSLVQAPSRAHVSLLRRAQKASPPRAVYLVLIALVEDCRWNDRYTAIKTCFVPPPQCRCRVAVLSRCLECSITWRRCPRGGNNARDKRADVTMIAFTWT